MILPIIGQVIGQVASQGGSSIDPLITDWAARVVINGGAAPSTNTKNALNTFYLSLVSEGIASKMKTVNCIVPDNLIAATTPLIKVAGIDPWTNTNYINADLSVNGLLDPENTAQLSTGFSPGVYWPSTENGGYTFCTNSGGSTTAPLMIAYEDSYRAEGITGTDAVQGDFGTQHGQIVKSIIGKYNKSDFNWTSVDRYDALLLGCFCANDDFGFQDLGTNNSAAGRPRPSNPIVMNGRGGPYPLKPPYAHAYSFVAIHVALNATETQAFYNAFRAMRVGLGGGYA